MQTTLNALIVFNIYWNDNYIMYSLLTRTCLLLITIRESLEHTMRFIKLSTSGSVRIQNKL